MDWFWVLNAIFGLCCISISQCDFVDVPVSEVCISCLCRVTECDTDIRCIKNACGPYRITKEYWMDSGNWTYNSHLPENPETFVKCATNFYCSTITVQEYMKKFKRDCNGDGRINCDDYVAIHVLGPNNCHNKWPEKYKQSYDRCKADYGA